MSNIISNNQKVLLQQFSIFEGVGAAEIMQIEERKKAQKLKKGEYIFRENEEARGVFCLKYGSAKIVKTGSSGREQILSLARPGDVFGLRSTINGTLYSVSVICLEDCSGCFIERENLFSLLEVCPRLKLNVMKILCDEIDEIEERILRLKVKPLLLRVVELILLLYKSYGVDKGNRLQISLTRNDLANIIHITRRSLNRVLSKLQTQELIRFGDDGIFILNIDGLKQIVT